MTTEYTWPERGPLPHAKILAGNAQATDPGINPAHQETVDRLVRERLATAGSATVSAAPGQTVRAATPRPEPVPRRISLPLGGDALMFTRENLTQLYRCSHGELGRMLARKMAPLPVRFDGQILWYVDEVTATHAQVIRTLERWRKR